MNYRSFNDLNRCILRNLHKIPRDVDLIVGIPRSGLLAANLLSLYLELPLADLDGFLEGRILSSGRTRAPNIPQNASNQFRKVLILDDSALSGITLERAKERVIAAQISAEVLFGVVYASPQATNIVDIFFEVCSAPRIFEWNLMHHSYLKKALIDIDGVLCQDPTEEQNDDGERYLSFLQNAKPLFLPRVRLGHLVTCRLERYRPQTEAWLAQHGLEYETLSMMPLDSKEERIRFGHAKFKAQVYERLRGPLFIESSHRQAREIALRTGKPVICLETHSLMPTGLRAVRTPSDARLLAQRWYFNLRHVTPRKLAARLFRLGRKLLGKGAILAQRLIADLQRHGNRNVHP